MATLACLASKLPLYNRLYISIADYTFIYHTHIYIHIRRPLFRGATRLRGIVLQSLISCLLVSILPFCCLPVWYLLSMAVLRSASWCLVTANRAPGQAQNPHRPRCFLPGVVSGSVPESIEIPAWPQDPPKHQNHPQGTPKPPSWTSFGRHFDNFLVTFEFSSGKRPTCDPLEPARSDCMSGGPVEVQFHHFLTNILGS